MSKIETEYIIEFQNPSFKSEYSRRMRGYKNKQIALDIAESYKRKASELKIRVVEQTRRVLRVL